MVLLPPRDPHVLPDHSTVSRRVTEATKIFDETPLDTKEIPQQSLDLTDRRRTNFFPWRGQFSPQLVELLLSRYASRDGLVLDPFAGVGTTLFEAARQEHVSLGAEINPSAFLMAGTTLFVSRSGQQRQEVCNHARRLLEKALPDDLPLFSRQAEPVLRPSTVVATLARQNSDNPSLYNIFANTLIRLINSPHPKDVSEVLRAFRQHQAILLDIPYSSQRCWVTHSDARCLPVRERTVKLVITSPPYVNVFNYHQNNRPAMELLGWDILAVARSEFGSNRKNRGNRFLTLVQYCADMALTFSELRRVLKPEGRIIIVVGRESSIRGISFQNGSLVTSLAVLCGFHLVLRQERKFTNKFGDLIYEDILHLLPDLADCSFALSESYAVAQEFLRNALAACEV